jgi:hypothetical protein
VLANSRGFSSIIGGVDPERIVMIEQALDLTGPEPSPIRAQLLALYASELTFTPDKTLTRRMTDEATAMARSFGDANLLSAVLTATVYTYSTGAAAHESVSRYAEMVQVADRSGDPKARAISRVMLGAAEVANGNFEKSDRILAEALALADDTSPALSWVVHSNEIRPLALAGRLDEADAANLATLQRGQELGEPDAEQWWAAATLAHMWLRGLAGEFADVAAAYIERYPLAIVWPAATAWLLADAGRHDEARALVATLEIDPDKLLAEPWPFVPTMQLALTAWELDDAALAAQLLDSLQPYRDCWVHYFIVVMGPVSWVLGILTVTAGDVDEGIDLLREARADLVRRGFPAHQTLVDLDLARALRRRGAPGDLELAARLTADARQRAAELGATGIVKRLDAASAR